MMDGSNGHRQIIRSTSIMGGASLINIIMGVVRTKVLAVLLGPAMIGLVSLYSALLATATTLATMGIGTVGTRQIAEALSQDDERALAVVRRAMFWGAMFLAIAGALMLWSLREVVAVNALGDAEHGPLIGWLALGVALSVASASQAALIQGLRRIGDMARLSVFSSILNTIFGVALLWILGQTGLVAYVLLGPLTSFLLGHWYVSRLPRLEYTRISIQELAVQWRVLLTLGVPFVGAGVVGAVTNLWIRVEIDDNFGLSSVGHFQAASTISMQYIGFVLAAMGADYYPRLTGAIRNHGDAVGLVNDQTEVALLLTGPIFFFIVGLTPLVVTLLYSSEFTPAVDILRWQILGDIPKVFGWPLGFLILAAGAGKTFFFVESAVTVLAGGLIMLLSPSVGVAITGMAFFAANTFYLVLVYVCARSLVKFQWRSSNVKLALLISTITATLFVMSSLYWWTPVVAVLLSLLLAFYAALKLTDMHGGGGPRGRTGILGRLYAIQLSLLK